MDNTTAYRIRTHAKAGYFLAGGLNWTVSQNLYASPELAESGRTVCNRQTNVDPARTVIIPVFVS